MSGKIIIIAGPNGAGKTTFARSFLPEEAQCPRFVTGLHNFEQHYRTCVSTWAKYDNAGDEPVLMEWGENT